MMDLHLLIVIACVVLASLGSLLFINKFFRRKTFEEIIAEKKAMSDKINAQNKLAGKKPKKQQQQLKKEQKREKKQRQREQQRENNNEEESDAQSEQQSVQEEDSNGLSKLHVEFEPDPEVMTFNQAEAKPQQQKANNADKENAIKSKSKKDKKSNKPAAGILVNKNEPVAVKEVAQTEDSALQANHFDVKLPKDFVEMKKVDKEIAQKKEEKSPNMPTQQLKKNAKKEKPIAAVSNAEQQLQTEAPVVAKEIKQQEEKARHGSPKMQQNGNASNATNQNTNTATKNKQLQKKQKDAAATKELVQSIDKLPSNDTISVNLLMNLFRRAELNRSEIQILIDYLLNKQQDTPSTHAEWSDDICQKLRRQLQEKEKALVEEQEASAGIQAKLRELRAEVNTERIQMNAATKAYADKMAAKEQEITALNQEMQNLNEKFNIERQQFQAKLMHEKQAGSQELLAQLQLMQNELAHKDKCVAELTHMVNASRQAVEESAQKNDFIQQLQQQIAVLEQQRDELEQLSNNRIFELEKLKTLETENGDYKVEVRNLQNALDLSKADLAKALQELEAQQHNLATVRNNELLEKQQEIDNLNAKIQELSQQLYSYMERSKEQTSLQVKLDALQQHVYEKEQDLLQQVARWEAECQQQKQQLQSAQELQATLQAEIADKQTKLQNATQHAEQMSSREQELLQQLHEQKEKNNDLRMKNWKLVEALQNAETTRLKQNKTSSANASVVQQEQLLIAAQKPVVAATISTNTEHFNAANSATSASSKEQAHMRELFGRLYPDAVKACASTALTASFDQWVEQVLATHVKQTISKNTNSSSSSSINTATASTATATISSSNKATQSNSNHYDTTTTTTIINHNTNNNNNHSAAANATNNNGNGRLNTSSSSDSSNYSSSGTTAATDAEMQRLNTQNLQLRAQIDELTKLVTKTSNTLSDIEERAREQDEQWRSIVRSKDELIDSLKHSNGEQDI